MPNRIATITSLGAASGAMWGVLALVIGGQLFASSPRWEVVTALLASPLIGIGASRIIWPLRSRTLPVRVMVAGVLLYAATALYGIAIGGAAAVVGELPMSGSGLRDAASWVLMVPATYVIGISITGIAVVLWPLAFTNCVMVWRIDPQ